MRTVLDRDESHSGDRTRPLRRPPGTTARADRITLRVLGTPCSARAGWPIWSTRPTSRRRS